jgi:hypothetical protein
MTALPILLTLGFFAYRAVFRSRKPGMSNPMPVPRSQLQGDAGEKLDELSRR